MFKLNVKRVIKWFIPYGILQLRKKIRRRQLNLPAAVSIEASTLCQLRCRGCPIDRQKQEFFSLGAGYLKFYDFKNFIDKHPFIKTVELAKRGEIFTNPQLLDIIQYAHAKDVALTAGVGVNFNTVSDEMLEALVKYQFRFMTIALDGVTQKTYSLYREGGDFDKVISNIKRLNEYKAEYQSEFPILQWQFVLMKDNEHDVVRAKEMAKELNMQMHFKPTWGDNIAEYFIRNGEKSGFENQELLKKETGLKYLTRNEYYEAHKQDWGAREYRLCQALWVSPQINWDGRLFGCIDAIDDDFGINVFKVGLEKALKSKYYVRAKKMLQGKYPPSHDSRHIPCINCVNYKNRIKNNDFITEFDT
jgi:MoaA/NifB/PqqE/SkfB family radical SAM enzyme